MEWWKQYEDYIVSNEVHIASLEREQAIQDGVLEKINYPDPERFMQYFKDGRHVIFDFNDYKYSVVYFPHQAKYGLTDWLWEVYSFEEGEPVGRARTQHQLNLILADCFRKAFIKGIQ
jgi:hypothetical protein